MSMISPDQIIGRRRVGDVDDRAVAVVGLVEAWIAAAPTQLTTGSETASPMTATSGSTHAELSPRSSTSVPSGVQRRSAHWTAPDTATPARTSTPMRS